MVRILRHWYLIPIIFFSVVFFGPRVFANSCGQFQHQCLAPGLGGTYSFDNANNPQTLTLFGQYTGGFDEYLCETTGPYETSYAYTLSSLNYTIVGQGLAGYVVTVSAMSPPGHNGLCGDFQEWHYNFNTDVNVAGLPAGNYVAHLDATNSDGQSSTDDINFTIQRPQAPTGTVCVSSNVISSWTVSGPTTGGGSGTGPSCNPNSTPGTGYSVSGADLLPGYTGPVVSPSPPQTLTNGGTINFVLTYTATGGGGCVSDGSCSAATPACGTTTTGTDNCGTSCTKTGGSCSCVSDGSCSAATPACGTTTTGADNCGTSCTKTGTTCPVSTVTPVCAATHYNCSVGTAINGSETSTTWSWLCRASGGDVSCTEPIPPPGTANIYVNSRLNTGESFNTTWDVWGPQDFGWGSGTTATYTTSNPGDYNISVYDIAGYSKSITPAPTQYVGLGSSITFTITYTRDGVPGCTDSTANNYNPSATVNDGSCTYPVSGCTDSTASNYNPAATVNQGCLYNYSCNSGNACVVDINGPYVNDPSCANACAPAVTCGVQYMGQTGTVTVVPGEWGNVTWQAANASVCTVYKDGAFYAEQWAPNAAPGNYPVTPPFPTDHDLELLLQCHGIPIEANGLCRDTVTIHVGPAPTYSCVGPTSQNQNCSNSNACNTTNGTQTQTRYCADTSTNPGTWSTWSDWSACSAPPPPALPAGYGNACTGSTSAANACGMTNPGGSGTIQCDGNCSGANGSQPADSSCPAPTASSVTYSPPNYCQSGPGGFIAWSYSDPNSSLQSAYQIQIDDQGSFQNNEYDSGQLNSSSKVFAIPNGVLQFNKGYKARVRSWNTYTAVSAWSTPTDTFNTPNYAYPNVIPPSQFTWPTLPKPQQNQSIQFTDHTIFGGGNTNSREWSWNFGDGGTSTQTSPAHTYPNIGNYTVTQTVTDAANQTCSYSQNINVQKPIPVIKEVAPR